MHLFSILQICSYWVFKRSVLWRILINSKWVFCKLEKCKDCSSCAFFIDLLSNMRSSSSDNSKCSFCVWATVQKKVQMFWPLQFDIPHCLDKMSEIILIIYNPLRIVFVKPFWHIVCYWSSTFYGTISTRLSIFILPWLGNFSYKYGEYMPIS